MSLFRIHKSGLKPALFCLLAALIAASATGCGTVFSKLARQRSFLEGDAAKAAADAVRDKFGNNARVLEVRFDAKEFTIKIQDPEKPQNVDSYKYAAGFFVKSAPVQLNGLERNLKKTLFDFSEVDLAAVSRLAAEIREKSQLADGEIEEIEIKRRLNLTADFENSGDVRWSVRFGNGRESVTAIADAKGKLLGVDLSQTSQAVNFNLLNEKEINQAADHLREAFGAQAKIGKISFGDKYMSITKLKNDDAEIADEFKYDVSGLTKPGLSQQTKIPLEEQFSLDEINLKDTPRLAKIALERLAAPQAQIYAVEIKRVNRVKNFEDETYQTVWVFNLKKDPGYGGRIGWVTFDAQGNLIKVVDYK